ncbi:MAG: polymerase subunit gamma/tau [Streptosporangiaceae bacterium]|nr:polymerase subunit gamma/tau [Streptosporangiaceae bacterium]
MAGDVPGTAPQDQAPPSGPPARLALYRRYRPATFADVKGQDHVTEPLRQALRNGRVNHAYLFSGPRGCGKTSSARILARSLNCAEGPTPDPCGKCESCVALAPDGPGSLDVIEIDAASHGGVDDARDLRERAFYSPVSGRFKIYIIDEAHMVSREGFNALLKLVEEPPPHLKFVFATTEPEKVLATIRSRTHHYPFRLVPPAVLRELLEEILHAEGIGYEPAVLPLVVRAGAGSARDSLSVLDQLLAGSGEDGLRYDQTVALLGYTDDSLLDEVADAFAGGDGAAVFRAVDRVVESGHDPRRFAADLLDRFRDLIILAAVPGAAQTGLLDLPADRLDRMGEQARQFGQAELARAAQILSEGLIEMRGTTSPRLLLELTCAQVLLPAAGTGEMAMLARLERLERRLEGASPAAEHGDLPRTSGESLRPAPSEAPVHEAPVHEAPVHEVPAHEAQAREAPVREAPVREAPVPDTSGEAAPEARAGQSAGPPPGSGRPDTDSVSQLWPEILEAIKGERRVAWMLLSNASVHSVADGVLTVRFAREGDVKGFSSSGCDRDLGRVLAERFGLKLQVRAVFAAQLSGTPAGPTAAGPTAADLAPNHPASSAAAPPQPGHTQPDHVPSAYAQSGPPRSEPVQPAPAQPDRAHPGSAHPGSVRSEPARSEPAQSGSAQSGSAQSGSAQSGSAQSGSAQSGRARPGSMGPDSAPAGRAAAAPAAGREDLTGMDLIKRELGGRVIAEIDEA